MNADLREALYRAVALCKYSWNAWETLDSPMRDSEVFRVFYMLMCLETAEERDRGLQIISQCKQLHKAVKERMSKMADNHYSIKAKKTWYTDQWGRKIQYDSILEARMARILDREGIKFEAHVLFNGLYTPQLAPFSYTVDFIFDQPQKFVGIPDILNGVEVKGALCRHDIQRNESLEFFRGVKVWIVTIGLIDFWEAEFTKKEKKIDGTSD